MSWLEWGVVGAVVVSAIGATAILLRVRRLHRDAKYTDAMKGFHRQREYLEAKFFDLASRSGKPRGLAWARCDFDNAVAYARDRQTGKLTALVGVTIGFTAKEGGDMEDVAAVSDLRAATAVFEFSEGRWTTRGRAIFNLNPFETIDYYQQFLEIVAKETA